MVLQLQNLRLYNKVIHNNTKDYWNPRWASLENESLLIWFKFSFRAAVNPLQWRHNERDGVSNHWRLDGLLSRLFRRRAKKTLKLRVTSPCVVNSLVTGEYPSQRATNTENVTILWRHHVTCHSWFREVVMAIIVKSSGHYPLYPSTYHGHPMSQSWLWIIDSHSFRSMSFGPPISCDKFMCMVKGQGHIFGPVPNWFAFFSFHII